MTDAIPVKRRDATSLGEFESADRAPMRFLQLPKGYIDGLKMEWVSGTSLRVTSGAAYVASLDRVLELPAAITKAGLSLTASAWYHVYLFDNAGAADVEVVTTAPAAPFSGAARAKTGDDSRRYVGSVLSDAGGGIQNFLHAGNKVYWRTGVGSSTRVLANGSASTPTNINLGIAAPLTAVAVSCRFTNNDNSTSYVISNADFPVNAFAFQVNVASSFGMEIATTNVPSISYWYLAPVSGGAFIDVISYTFER